MIPALLIAVSLLISACGPPGPPKPPFVAIEAADATKFIRVEIAETEPDRQRGLMGRTELEEGAGMIFIWPSDTDSGFWMKDTKLRLSIAFISAEGQILKMLDMDPCTADPCPIHDPRVTYRMALEVRQGAFERLGVRVGDRVRLVRS